MIRTHAVRTIEDLRTGAHLCCLYETEEEHQAAVTPFLRRGLEQGEKVLYIVDAHPPETALNYLRDDGLQVEPYLERGQLLILTYHDTYMREGVFDPDEMVAWLRTETEQALAEGYPALRVTGEMAWAVRGLPGSERLIEYEARLDVFLSGSRCLALCQYDRRRFDPEVLLDVLRTHPIAMAGAEVYENFYYVPPTSLPGSDVASARLEHWLQNLAEQARREKEREVREARIRTIIEDARTGMYIVQEGKFLYVNPALARAFGYMPDELVGELGLGLVDLVHPTDRVSVEEHIRRCLAGEVELMRCTFRGLDRGGRVVHYEGLGRRIEYGGRPAIAGVVLDINERVRAEEGLQESEAKYRRLFENANDAIYLIDPKTTRILDCNEKAAEMDGYSIQELKNMAVADLHPADERGFVPEKFREIAEKGSETGVSGLHHVRKDGRLVPIEVNATMVEVGEDALNLSIVRDITERKAAEAQQAHLQGLLRAIGDVNRIIMREKDPQAMLQEACELLQRTREYHGLWIGLLDETGQHIREVASAGAATGATPAEFSLHEPGQAFHCVRTALSERRPYLVRDVAEPHPCADCPLRTRLPHQGVLVVPLLHHERVYGVLVAYSDRPWAFDNDELDLLSNLASDLALGLHALEEKEKRQDSEARFRQMAENIPEVFWLVTPDRKRLIYVSPACEEILGRPREGFYERPMSFLDIVHPEDREYVIAGFERRAGAEFNEGYDEEFRIVRPGGTVRWIWSRYRPIRNDLGEVYRIAGVSADITARKQMEERLQASLREKEVLLKEIHHRVKNNLQVISSLLKLQAEYTRDEQVLQVLQESRNRIRSMALIHEKLYHAGDLARIDFAEYIRSLASHLFQTYQTSAKAIVLKINAENVSLGVDRAISCGLIINELISNSLKHAFPAPRQPAGSSGKEENEIRVEFHSEGGDELTLILSDNGIGMPEELDLRGVKTLGLELVDMLVEQLGGTIELERTGGTRYRITFGGWEEGL